MSQAPSMILFHLEELIATAEELSVPFMRRANAELEQWLSLSKTTWPSLASSRTHIETSLNFETKTHDLEEHIAMAIDFYSDATAMTFVDLVMTGGLGRREVWLRNDESVLTYALSVFDHQNRWREESADGAAQIIEWRTRTIEDGVMEVARQLVDLHSSDGLEVVNDLHEVVIDLRDPDFIDLA